MNHPRNHTNLQRNLTTYRPRNRMSLPLESPVMNPKRNLTNRYPKSPIMNPQRNLITHNQRHFISHLSRNRTNQLQRNPIHLLKNLTNQPLKNLMSHHQRYHMFLLKNRIRHRKENISHPLNPSRVMGN